MEERRGRGSPLAVLAVLLWLATFGAIAWGVHAALFFFPESWRWTNDDRARTVWTLRQALALVLALPLSLWVVAEWPGQGRRLRRAQEEADRAAGVLPPIGGEIGCGGIILALVAATLLLRPAALALFPLIGLDPDRGGGLPPFLLWGVLAVAGIAAGRAVARARR